MINDIVPATPDEPIETKKFNEKPEPVTEKNVAFKTPEQIAAEHATDLLSNPKLAALETSEHVTTKPPRWRPSQRQWFIGGAVVIVLIAGASSWWLLYGNKPAPVDHKVTVVIKKPVIVVPKTVPSNLSGLPVDPNLNKGPVTGVMIENSDLARPQSGLGQASVVFEAIAEGGITRFLALFQDTAPLNVGPIRSVRPYYEQWALGFDASVAHVGGSPEALADLKSWSVHDLDQFANGGSYHRISTREAPHNVYTGIPTLNQLEASKGITTSTYTSLARKVAAPLKAPTAKTINFAISGPDFNVSYVYNPATNSYDRSEAGAPHIDAETGTQISPKVVVGLVMPYALEADGYHSSYNTIGSGPVYVFQDGGVSIGQWTKNSNVAQFTFADANGTVIKLNPGITWFTALAATSNISYAP